LPKLLKRLKNKKVVFYGAGVYLELIKKYFDLSSLNVIAISDKKFENMEESEFLGYKTCSPDKIKDLNPDYVIITTKFCLIPTKTKVRFLTICAEPFSSI